MAPANDNVTPSPHIAAHLRALTALHDSLYAPRFRALETYGEVTRGQSSAQEILAAARSVCSWHEDKEKELAVLLATQRTTNAPARLIDETLRLLAHHRGERDRIAASLRDLQPISPTTEATVSGA